MHLLVNVLNIRKCKVWIGVKFILIDFILLIIPKEEITLRSSALWYFLRRLAILALMIMLIALCYVILHYISNFWGQCVCLVAIAIRWESSRQASGRNELLQFADRCNKLLELSRNFALPSPPRHPPSSYFLHDLWHGLFFNSFYLLSILFCDSRLLSHRGCYDNVSARHTVHYSARVPTCQIFAIL